MGVSGRDLDAIAALALGPVQRIVGALQQFVDRFDDAQVGHAGREGDRQWRGTGGDGVRVQRGAQPLDTGVGAVVLRIRQQKNVAKNSASVMTVASAV